jgi:hypothetical protein
MILSAIWHLVPWYGWLLALLAVVVFTYLGLWPIVIGFLRRVPWQVWAILGTAAVAIIWLNYHDAALRDAVTRERNAFWKAREDKANKDYADALVALHRKLEIADSNAKAAADKHALELAARDKKHAAVFAALELERKRNVTAKANADCSLTAGVILQFNAGAAGANGSGAAEAPAATGPGAVAVDAPAGVSLDQLVDGINATQAALGTARNQVKGWQTYHANVVQPWITSTLEAFSTCIPKGSP